MDDLVWRLREGQLLPAMLDIPFTTATPSGEVIEYKASFATNTKIYVPTYGAP